MRRSTLMVRKAGRREAQMNEAFRDYSEQTRETWRDHSWRDPMTSQLTSRALVVVSLLSLATPVLAAGAVTIGQSNPGTIDINRTIDPQLVGHAGAQPAAATPTPVTTSTSTTSSQVSVPAASSPITTSGSQTPFITGAVSPPLQPNTGANGVPLTATSSGAPTTGIPSAAPTTGIGTTAVLGASGRDMDECLAAWDSKTHISKSRWRQICKSTLAD